MIRIGKAVTLHYYFAVAAALVHDDVLMTFPIGPFKPMHNIAVPDKNGNVFLVRVENSSLIFDGLNSTEGTLVDINLPFLLQ